MANIAMTAQRANAVNYMTQFWDDVTTFMIQVPDYKNIMAHQSVFQVH